MSTRVSCSHCGTPIKKDSNGVWIDPDAPEHLALVECAPGVEVGGHVVRSYHDYYGEDAS